MSAQRRDNTAHPQGSQRKSGAGQPATMRPGSVAISEIILLVVVIVFLYWIQKILLPFIIAGVLAYICTPLVDWLAARTRIPRFIVAIAGAIVVIGIIAGVASLGVAPLMREMTLVATDFKGVIERLAQEAIGTQTITLFGWTTNASQLSQAAVDAVHDWIGNPGALAMLAGISFAALFGFFLILILLFYFFLSGRRIATAALRMVPPRQRPLVERIAVRLDPVLKRYFVGVLAVVVYATIAAYIGLGLVLNLSHALFLALATGMLEVIPIVGPAIAIVLAGLAAVHYATGTGSIIGYAIYVILLRLSIDQLFGPLVLGSAARVHPALVIFCFLSGAITFGIPGVILAVPVALAIKTAAAVIYEAADEGRSAS